MVDMEEKIFYLIFSIAISCLILSVGIFIVFSIIELIKLLKTDIKSFTMLSMLIATLIMLTTAVYFFILMKARSD